MNAITRTLVTFSVALGTVSACNTQSDVLSTTTDAQLQKADGTWMSWCADSRDPSFDVVTFMTEAAQGLACTAPNIAWGCATALDSHNCGWNIRNCVDGRVQATTTATMGCPVSSDTVGSDVWTDCASALVDANSGDPCSWQGACSRTTDDPCCIEAAVCQPNTTPKNIVQRNRICAPGCTGIVPDTSKPKVTTCAELSLVIDKYAVPCDPALACHAYESMGQPAFLELSGAESEYLSFNPLYFCADGKVMFMQEPFGSLIF